MGTLRFSLALWVLLSHGGVAVFGLNPGVAAVVVFYLISGHVMADLLSSHYAGLRHARAFYLDRFLRIYPQYLLYLGLTALWWWWSDARTAFLQHSPSPGDVLNNLLIVPLNFFMFNGADAVTLLPAAWSLGAEIQFYLLAPLFWCKPRLAVVLGGLSLLVHACTWAGWLHADWWGYRLLPGVLWVFLLGMLAQRWRHRPAFLWGVVLVVAALAGTVSIGLWQAQRMHIPYHREILLGVALGLPAVIVLSRWKISGRLRWLDQYLGHCAYGVFLNHFLALWLLPQGAPTSMPQWLVWAAISITLAALTYVLVDRPVGEWRKVVRRRQVH